MSVNKVVYGGNTLIDLSSDTVTANKMLSGIKAHDKSGAVITGSIASQAAQTITPGTADKTIAAGKYLSGEQTIKGDANLVAGNIAKDVTIFGVTGTHEGGEDVSAETAEYTSLLTDLETAIDALPDAGSGGGSGGSVETCTVKLYNGGSGDTEMTYVRTDGTLNTVRLDSENYIEEVVVTDVVKNSICCITGVSAGEPFWGITGSCTAISSGYDVIGFFVYGDCSFGF